MDYRAEYAKKLTTPEQAVSIVKSGDWVEYGWNCSIPVVLDRALAARMPELYDIKVRGGNTIRKPAIFDVENAAEHFCYNSMHCSGLDRKYMESGLVYYTPIRFSELPRYYRENMERNNVTMLMVGPMDEHGYFNFGPSGSHIKAACDISDKIIVEVNPQVPKCLGGFEESIHISDVDMIVEGESAPMPAITPGQPDEQDEIIAKYIVDEISDGCCLQLGIGNTPNAVGSLLLNSDLKDLGVHSEMYVDAFMQLSLAGKINSSKKKIDRYRQTYSFAAGTPELYEFLDDNPASSIDNFISINSCINVDLFGQVGAESTGFRHISGAGGQLDFVMGAHLSKGGKSFICLKSARAGKDGSLTSNILPNMCNGSIITDTRANTMYVVTEQGMVNLKGMTTWQRAEAVISIAHPQFRDELIKNAEEMHIWRKSNKR